MKKRDIMEKLSREQVLHVAHLARINLEEEEIETHEVPQDIQLTYVEPIEYMPEELRKEFKLGEYAEDDE